jgi:hypothetical protein
MKHLIFKLHILYQNMKEEILEGLMNAVAKGESLKYAMQSFYNAGYEKRDIEWAAQELNKKINSGNSIQNHYENPTSYHSQEGMISKEQSQIESPGGEKTSFLDKVKNIFPKISKTRIQPKYAKEIIPKDSTTKISNYKKQDKHPRKMIIVILVILILILFIGLGIIFLFRENLISFFNSLFG